MTQPQDADAAGMTSHYGRRLAYFLVLLLMAAVIVVGAVVAALGVQSGRRGSGEVATAPPPKNLTSAPSAPAAHPPPKWSKFRPRAAVLRTAFDSPPTSTDLDRPEGFVVPLIGRQDGFRDVWEGSAPITGAACKYIHVEASFIPRFSWAITVGGSNTPRWPFVVGGEGRDGFQGGVGRGLWLPPDGMPEDGAVWFGGKRDSMSAAWVGLTDGPRPSNPWKDKGPKVEVSLVE